MILMKHVQKGERTSVFGCFQFIGLSHVGSTSCEFCSLTEEQTRMCQPAYDENKSLEWLQLKGTGI